MASCAACGAPIRWATDADGAKVPLDTHEVSLGPDRYAISDEGQLIPVREHAQVLAYPDHRTTCPAHRR